MLAHALPTIRVRQIKAEPELQPFGYREEMTDHENKSEYKGF
jgi:hypothetical protein